jgi:hypothetical protein
VPALAALRNSNRISNVKCSHQTIKSLEAIRALTYDTQHY